MINLSDIEPYVCRVLLIKAGVSGLYGGNIFGYEAGDYLFLVYYNAYYNTIYHVEKVYINNEWVDKP